MMDTVRAFLEPRHLDLEPKLRAFAESLALPEPKDDAAARVQAREFLAKLGAAGWFRDADLRTLVMMREILGAASPLADAVFALQWLGSMPIRIADPKNQWIEEVAAGRAMAAFAMTEAEAGSDVASMTTSARQDGARWLVDGRKTLISNAGIADFYTVFASTGPKSIQAFVVEAKHVKFLRPQVLSAPHPLGEIAFEAAPAKKLEGDGFKLGLETLDRLRATVAAAACGMASRALAEATAHVKRRRQFGKPLAEFQLVQQRLAAMATDLAASRLLVYRAAWEKDQGAARVTLPSAMAKVFATEAAQRIVDGSLQLLGGIGMLADHPVERLYRAVRSLRVYEGATDILQLVIAGQLLK